MPRVRCIHDWRLEWDWAGDPGVINGTYSWSFFRCRSCGAEREASDQEARDYEQAEDEAWIDIELDMDRDR